MIELRRRLRWLMWRYDIPAAEMAAQIGIHKNSLSRLLNGDIPHKSTLEKISKTYGVSVNWLLGEGKPEEGDANAIKL